MRGIQATPDGGVSIGALTTLAAIEHSPLIRRDYPVLYHAAKTVASPVLRNMGTIGGNICLDTRCLWYNQSLLWRKSCGFCLKKDGDLVPCRAGRQDLLGGLLGRYASRAAVSWGRDRDCRPDGLRRVPLAEFYVNDGIVRLHLSPNEIVTRVLLPEAAKGWRGSYQKLRVRGSIDYPLAGVAVALKMRQRPRRRCAHGDYCCQSGAASGEGR